MSDKKKQPHQRQTTMEQLNMGVILTGYLGKMKKHNHEFYQRRFVVLTYTALHWFEREEGYDLFGKEANHLQISDIVRCEVRAKRANHFEVESKDRFLRRFEADDEAAAERWVGAIQGVMTALAHGVVHRLSVSAIDNTSMLADPDLFAKATVVLVSAQRCDDQGVPGGHEVVLAKDVSFEEPVELPHLGAADVLHVLMSDGSSTSVPFTALQEGQIKGVMTRRLRGSGPPGEVEFAVSPVTLVRRQINNATSLFPRLRCLASGPVPPPKYTCEGDLSPSFLHAALDGPLGLVLPGLYLLVFAWGCFHGMGGTGSLLGSLGVLLALHCLMGGAADRECEVRCSWTLHFREHRLLAAGDRGKNEVPVQFLEGCPPVTEACRRWELTRQWREDADIDGILMEAQPHFHNIKRFYPHFCCGRTREGDIVYYEQVGGIDLPALKAMNLSIDTLVRHYLFTTEFTWRMTHPRTGGRTLTIFDVAGVALSDLAGDAKAFLTKSMALVQNHYPERSRKILIINAPGWFSIIWKAIRGWINEETRKKISILTSSETFAGISDLVDPSQIPTFYGGEWRVGDGSKEGMRFYAPQEIDLRRYVDLLNERCGGDETKVDMPPPGEGGGDPPCLGEREEKDQEVVLIGDLPPEMVKGAYDEVGGTLWTTDGPVGVSLPEQLKPAHRSRSRSADPTQGDLYGSTNHRSTGSLSKIFMPNDDRRPEAISELARSEHNSPLRAPRRAQTPPRSYPNRKEEGWSFVEGSMEHPVYQRPDGGRRR